ncbi:transcription termination/antitermination protein NusA [Patescibacteria group bacterium]|nr:MAG: transcription termination/antitermination protein NusA [Patescibacteria group bacterium]
MARKKTVASDESQTGRLGEFGSAIAQIADEKGISKDKVIETIEAALAAAYKKDYGKKGQHIRAEFGEVVGDTKFFKVLEVVDETTREFPTPEEMEAEPVEPKEKRSRRDEAEESAGIEGEVRIPRFNPERDILVADANKIKKGSKVGDVLEIELESKKDYGRIAAQTAKQVIIQKIREAERDAMFKEYKEKEGEVLNGVVQRIEGRNVFVDLGKSVGILFPSEQIESERYNIGQRIKVFLARVEADPKGPGITLSRTHPDIVRKLFELEVPEIFAGTVEIKSLAREAGSRTKIAVTSKEEGIDPIGSCVGQKGTRVQAVIDELGGEKIDIIEWNEDARRFIGSALSPAKVLSVELDEAQQRSTVKVPEDQLSLAIGRQGQNVRLAAKLTGWKIDVVGDKVMGSKEEVVVESATEEGAVPEKTEA